MATMSIEIHFLRDGRLLATIGGEGEVRIWDIASGRVLHTLRHAATVSSVTFSPDGRILATATLDNRIRLWDVASGDERAVLAGHKHTVESLAFSPDGAILASASDDRTVRIVARPANMMSVQLMKRMRTVVTWNERKR